MVIYFNYLYVWGDICWCGDFGGISRECIFLVDKCEEATSSGGVRPSLLYAPCECVCVVENEFEFWE